MEGVHDTLYNLMCYLYIGVINRIIAVVQILLIFGIFRWSFHYMRSKEYTSDEAGVGVYEHLKYDRFTRINGLLMLTVFIVVAIWRGCELQW